MKNKKNFFIRLIFAAAAIISLLLLLLSPIRLNVDNTQKMAKSVLVKVSKKAKQPDLRAAAKMIRSSGLETNLLASLPQHFTVTTSYADLYHLSRIYRQRGQLVGRDLGLKNHNRLQAIINDTLVAEINAKLKEERADVSNVISIYQYSIILIMLLFLLAVILFILNRLWAPAPLLVGAGASFGALWYLSQIFNHTLQSRVYRGISLTLDSGIWLGLIVALGLALAWPFVLKKFKKKAN